MIITVHKRDVYGVVKYYPVCTNAKLFARIAKTTTLTDDALRHIREMGYEIRTAPDATLQNT